MAQSILWCKVSKKNKKWIKKKIYTNLMKLERVVHKMIMIINLKLIKNNNK